MSSFYAANVYVRCFTQILCLNMGQIECQLGLQIYSIHIYRLQSHDATISTLPLSILTSCICYLTPKRGTNALIAIIHRAAH